LEVYLRNYVQNFVDYIEHIFNRNRAVCLELILDFNIKEFFLYNLFN